MPLRPPLKLAQPDDVARQLREWRGAAGQPSFTELTARVAAIREARGVPAVRARPGRVTVFECFKDGRKRFDVELVVDLARALAVDDVTASEWEAACWALRYAADAARFATASEQLPESTGEFVGRTGELGVLAAARLGQRLLVSGMPGIGKSRLAVEAARRLQASGAVRRSVLCDLRGFASDQPPASAEAVLDAISRVVLDEPLHSPGVVRQRAEGCRRALSACPTVIVLDDAAGASQVAPLLPVLAPAITIVTSRYELAIDLDAVAVPLGPLDRRSALRVIEARREQPFSASEAEDLADVVDATGGVPLALDLVAGRIAARPEWRARDHAASLRTWTGGIRLDDAVRGAIERSYALASPAAQRALRLLAIQPCIELDRRLASALLGDDAASPGRSIDELIAANLALRPRSEHLGLHTLVREYGRERSLDVDREADREAALVGMLDAVLAATLSPRGAEPGGGAARHDEWIDGQLGNVLALAFDRCSRLRPRFRIGLSEALWPVVERMGRHAEVVVIHHLAIEDARELGDDRSEALAWLRLAQSELRLGEFDDAERHLIRAQRVFDGRGDVDDALTAENAIAVIAAQRGDLEAALGRFRTALRRANDGGLAQKLPALLDNLGVVSRRLGRLEDAARYHERAAEASVSVHNVTTQAQALANVSDVYLELGDAETARDAAARALAICTEHGVSRVAPWARTNFASALELLGRATDAEQEHLLALAEAEQLGALGAQIEVLSNLGQGAERRGDAAVATMWYRRAVDLAGTGGNVHERERALAGLRRNERAP